MMVNVFGVLAGFNAMHGSLMIMQIFKLIMR